MIKKYYIKIINYIKKRIMIHQYKKRMKKQRYIY